MSPRVYNLTSISEFAVYKAAWTAYVWDQMGLRLFENLYLYIVSIGENVS